MSNLQGMWQTIGQFYKAHEVVINTLVSGSLVFVAVEPIKLLWSYRNQQRAKNFSPSTFPFEIIRPNSDVLSLIFNGSKDDPYSRLPYPLPKTVS